MDGNTLMLDGMALALGAATGSFLNVAIYRLPRGESVVAPRSHCTKCERVIPWYDNLPVLSWILLRGRCRGCAEPFSIRYPIVEALTGVILLALSLQFGWGIGLGLHGWSAYIRQPIGEDEVQREMAQLSRH